MKPFRVGRSDVTLDKWETPKMFPFKSMCGLSRDNTFLLGGGTPYAWGYTYRAPFNHQAVTTGAIFETKRLNLEYECKQTSRNIKQMKHDISMLDFFKRPAPMWGLDA